MIIEIQCVYLYISNFFQNSVKVYLSIKKRCSWKLILKNGYFKWKKIFNKKMVNIEFEKNT